MTVGVKGFVKDGSLIQIKLVGRRVPINQRHSEIRDPEGVPFDPFFPDDGLRRLGSCKSGGGLRLNRPF